MTESEEKDALLKAIAENPYDRATRLVFADWLEERGLDDEATEQRTWTKEKQEKADAKEWLEQKAVEHDVEYKQLLDAGYDYAEQDQELWVRSKGGVWTHLALTPTAEEEFWKNWTLATGEEKPEESYSGCPTCSENWDEEGNCSC